MRVPLIKTADLTEQQKPLYEDMRQGIAANFQGFASIGSDGALLGPWNPWLHEPKFGKPVWELVKTMVSNPSLPASVREVAILVNRCPFSVRVRTLCSCHCRGKARTAGRQASNDRRRTAARKPEPAGRRSLRLCVRACEWWRAAGIDLSRRRRAIWPARCRRAILSRRSILPCLRHTEQF